MSNTNTKPTGYICVEMETGACDGIYTEKSTAKHMIGFMNNLWSGSHWILMNSYSVSNFRNRFHREQPMQEKLKRLYGDPDYDAADKYDKLHNPEMKGSVQQAGYTAEEYMKQAVKSIDALFEEGYAKKHPELIVAFMKTAVCV